MPIVIAWGVRKGITIIKARDGLHHTTSNALIWTFTYLARFYQQVATTTRIRKEVKKNMAEAALTPETALPTVGYSIPEVERILGLPQKSGYRLVSKGKLRAYTDTTGRLKVHQYELWKYMN